jgi:hypothetical protein
LLPPELIGTVRGMRLRLVIVVAVMVIAVLTVIAVSVGPTLAAATRPGSTPRASTVQPATTAAGLLASLAVHPDGPKTGYSRAQFGPAWEDVDGNHCDTRDDVLNRDLTAKTWRTNTRNCVVLTGMLADPYTARSIAFSKAHATAVQIDHVVALSNAWQTGARDWDAGKRLRFANDPLNLLAVDGPTNEAKGDADAAHWLPPNRAYRCVYVARQITVKAAYGLWVTVAERAADTAVLRGCPNQPPAWVK